MSTIQLYYTPNQVWPNTIVVLSFVLLVLSVGILGNIARDNEQCKHKVSIIVSSLISIILSITILVIGMNNSSYFEKPAIDTNQIENAYGISAFHFNQYDTPSIDDNDSFDVRFVDAQGKPQTGRAVVKDKKMTLYVYNTSKTLKLYKAEAK